MTKTLSKMYVTFETLYVYSNDLQSDIKKPNILLAVVVSLLILLDLLGCLHLDTEAAATGHQGVIRGVSCKVTS